MAIRRLVLAVVLLLIGGIRDFGQEVHRERDGVDPSHKIHKREQWFAQGRVSAQEPSAAARYHALWQKMEMRAARRTQRPRQQASVNALAGEWVPLGPAPVISDASGVGLQDYNFVAGRATAIAIDPADSFGNTVYVGGAFGGVWKSNNAGPLSSDPGSVAWVPLADNQATLAVGSIAIQPQLTNPDPSKSVILVGTGETNGSADSYYGLGILRSPDAGNSWKLISNDSSATPRSFAGLGFSKIAFSTSNPSLVVAGAAATAKGVTDGKESPSIVNRGIYYSSDSGVSWKYANLKDGSATADPSSVTSVAYNAAASQFFAGVSQHGIYSSSDGINWLRLANQPGSLTAAACPARIGSPSICPIYRGEFAIVPNRAGPRGKGEMYVWFVDANDNDGGIWSTTDAGTTWTQINDKGITSCGDLLGGCGTSQGFYNLTLSAVPDGTATDLYAGAVNLYKCTISVISPNCNSTGSGAFINLTHVYGCSSIARVHPAQHSVASILINDNNQALMYFANDGGIYRALDGYTGLVTGSCGGSNIFDSLNQTLGSMTQLISFSESSTNSPTPDILLAGAEGNGSPATVTAQNSTSWQNVDAGDGGFTAISPDDDNAWFVSNPPDSLSGVNIFKCDLGINCRTEDFFNSQIVSGTTVGGDAGAFNTPFVFDPQNSGELIVGTCRVWRGPVAGGSFTDLSFNFETGGTGICSGSETNLVRALAAGGAKDGNGLSNVIYAGTDGAGPLSTGLPIGGHVWVSTNVGGGPSTWSDQTGDINPGNFPVSSIAVDSSDPAGLTAYVTIMGFHVSHVWKTIDGGVSWTDFTANLPDAPVNAALVDPGVTSATGIIYLGTDVGVFASSTGTADWTEVGPSPASGNPGFLPNVAVTALHIFNPAGARRLRASTYGRGMWELAGFNLSRPVPSAVTLGTPDTSPVVTLQLTAAFGGAVNLSCNAPAWAQCNFTGGGATLSVNVGPANPATITLTISTVANAPSGPVSIEIHAAAPGYTTQTQDLPLTVVGGFVFAIVNGSGTQTIIAGQAATYNLSVAPSSGTFPSPVTLSCSGLPAPSACSFSPATVPAGNEATSVTLTVATQAGTPPGTYSAIIVRGTAGFADATAQLTLTVQNTFSFSLSNSGPGSIIAGNSAKYDITVTPSSGTFTSAVALTFLGCPLGTACTFDTATIAAGSGTTDVFLTVATTAYPNGSPPGPYSISISGTSSGSQPASTAVSFTVQAAPFSFAMSNSGPAAIEAGSSGKYDITITPSGSAFPNPAVLSLTGCSSASITCSLSSMQVPAGSGITDIFLTVASHSGTPAGPYKITVTSTCGTQTANTVISFVVHSNTFSFSISSSGPATVAAGSSGKYDITVTPSTGTFPNPVALVFTGCPASATCSLDNSTVTSGSGTTDVFLTVASAAGTPAGNYSIAVTGTSGAIAATTTISLSVIAFNFTMGSSGPATITVGSSAKYDVTITPSSGTFTNPVAITFTGCPAVSNCSLNSTQIAAGSGVSDVFMTVATTGPALHSEKRRSRILLYALWIPLPGIVIVFAGFGARTSRWTLRTLFTLLLVATCSGCGGLSGGSAAPAPNPGTPPGVYTITVIGTSGSLTANTTISITVQNHN